MGQPLWKAVWRRYLKKLKMDLPFDPVTLTSKNIPEETQNTNSKEHKYLYVHCSIIYNSQDLKAVQVFVIRQADEKIIIKAVIHLHNGTV